MNEQRVATWQAKWKGEAIVYRAKGDATLLSQREIGRAEAQANIITKVLEILKDPQIGSLTEDDLKNLFLLRSAQIFESIAEKNRLQSGAEKTENQE